MPPTQPTAAPVTWTHLLISPPPERIPHADNSVDEVLLEGTVNASLTAGALEALLAEALRVLRPGGSISVHGLVSDRPFPGRPALPGPAAMVQTVPIQTEPLEQLRRAGFVGLFYQRLGDIHCFAVDGVELRELLLTGVKPMPAAAQQEHCVLYRGPLERLQDDAGRSYPRGQRVTVDAATWQLFQTPPFAELFTCFAPKSSPALEVVSLTMPAKGGCCSGSACDT
jgi:hypothetical protein